MWYKSTTIVQYTNKKYEPGEFILNTQKFETDSIYYICMDSVEIAKHWTVKKKKKPPAVVANFTEKTG